MSDEEFARVRADLHTGRHWPTAAEWQEFARRHILYCGRPPRPMTVREYLGLTRADSLSWPDEAWELFAELGRDRRWFLGIALDALPDERDPDGERLLYFGHPRPITDE